MATLRTRGLLVAAFLAASFGMHASYRHTVHTPVSDLQLKQVVVDSVIYVEPVIDGYYNAGVVGEPSLPLTTICVSVPYNAENFTIIYNTNDSTSIKTEVPLYRNPIPVTSNGKVLPLAKLGKKDPEDSQPVKLMGVSFIGGINKVVKVGISPFCYKEEDNSLLCYSSIDVTLNWSIGTADESLTPVY
ncbi:MAG: hypothetical protein K2L37_00070, partial [Lactobacillus sp.]|nr:hypothetical protein [Lactobacillus sp.]